MLDAVGVTQHHDAITGTCLHDISVYYKNFVYDRTQVLMPAYSEVIGSLAKDAGYKGDIWGWCNPYSGSVYDCPITRFDLGGDHGMVVAVHNPSDTCLEEATIKVPHGSYQASIWDEEAKTQKDVKTEVICENP